MDQKWITSWRISSPMQYLGWDFCRYWDRSKHILHFSSEKFVARGQKVVKIVLRTKIPPIPVCMPLCWPFHQRWALFLHFFQSGLALWLALTNEWNVSEVVRCELWNLCLKRALKLLLSFCWKPETATQGSQSSQHPAPITKCVSVAILDLLAQMTVCWVSELKWNQQRSCLAHRIVKTSCEVHRIVKIIFCLPS